MRLKPIDYVLDYELKLQLPLNLMTLCKSSDEIGIYEMLCALDKKYSETFAMGQQLQRILFQRQATIGRYCINERFLYSVEVNFIDY